MAVGTVEPQDGGTEAVSPTLDRWKYRRRMAVGSVIYFSVMLALLAIFGSADSELHKLIAQWCAMSDIAVIGFYIGAPVADDWLQKGKGS